MTYEEFLSRREMSLHDKTREERDEARRFLLTALREGTDESKFYRFLSGPDAEMKGLGGIEKDVSKWLHVFKDDELLRDTYWRRIRRFALERYSFGLLRKTYANWLPGSFGAAFGFAKDVAMLRIPMAMLLAYGTLLGSGDLVKWIAEFGKKSGLHLGGGVVVCLVAAWALVYLNVHDKLGRIEHARKVGIRRTACVLLVAMFWGIASNFLIAWLDCQIHNPRAIPQGGMDHGLILVTLMALVFAILGQFFFTGGKSIAEPL